MLPTYLVSLNKPFIGIDIAALLEYHELLCKVKRNLVGHPIARLQDLLELGGADLSILGWDIVPCRMLVSLKL